MRETQSRASSDAPRIFQRKAMRTWAVLKTSGRQERSWSPARKMPGWIPGQKSGPGCPSVPPRESLGKFRSQCPVEREGGPTQPGFTPAVPSVRENRPRGKRTRPISAQDSALISRPAPRTASPRPLGGACALAGASPRGHRGERSPETEATSGSRRLESSAGSQGRIPEPRAFPLNVCSWGGQRGGRRALRAVHIDNQRSRSDHTCRCDRDPETRGLRAGPRGRAEHQVARIQTSSGKHAQSPEQHVLKGEKSCCCQSDFRVGAEC